jgi:hypothetical protein
MCFEFISGRPIAEGPLCGGTDCWRGCVGAVHDFPQLVPGQAVLPEKGNTYSITLNGRACIQTVGAVRLSRAASFRMGAHSHRSPDRVAPEDPSRQSEVACGGLTLPLRSCVLQ